MVSTVSSAFSRKSGRSCENRLIVRHKAVQRFLRTYSVDPGRKGATRIEKRTQDMYQKTGFIPRSSQGSISCAERLWSIADDSSETCGHLCQG